MKRSRRIATVAKIPWLRVFVEGTVIVASILLAFGIDAGWQERMERQAERVALQQLSVEFTENRDRLNQSVAPRVATASDAVYERIMAMARGAESLAVADTLLQLLDSPPTFDPVTPVLDGLVRSGRLEIIRDPNVRSRIAAWERALAQLTETEIGARSFLQTQLRPALAARGDLARVFSGGPLDDPGGVTVLRVDSEFKALIALRRNQTNAVISVRHGLRDTIDELLVAIGSAQDR